MGQIKREYYPTGDLKYEVFVIDGKYEGHYKEYFQSQDNNKSQLQVIYNYVNGEKNGPYKLYYEDGQLLEISNCFNNKVNGEFKKYHKNGKLWIDTQYIDDKRYGEYKSYHSNGKIREIRNYVNGEEI